VVGDGDDIVTPTMCSLKGREIPPFHYPPMVGDADPGPSGSVD